MAQAKKRAGTRATPKRITRKRATVKRVQPVGQEPTRTTSPAAERAKRSARTTAPIGKRRKSTVTGTTETRVVAKRATRPPQKKTSRSGKVLADRVTVRKGVASRAEPGGRLGARSGPARRKK